LLVVVAVVAPFLTSHDPLARDLDHGLSALGAPLSPSGSALLGTDALGRDVWARLVAGAGTSLLVAACATLLAVGFGVAIGLTAGYRGGWVDNALMRGVDLVLAFPALLLAILLGALLRETSLAGSRVPVILVLGAIGWTTIARVVRAKAMVIARADHVTAARALGASPWRIVTRHVLPGVAGLALAMAALTFAQALLNESVLSFLGLGPPPPAPSWGRMLFEGREYYRTAPHLVLAPGIAIVIAVAAFHLLADGLRAIVDPEAAR
jgi:ABC-type dipeptide/oligopeptide/nickel transport system permease subunit